MSIPADFLSEEQFSCSICLDIFNNPVSTPCGHSFCMSCITLYWDSRGKSFLCPLCKESYRKRPELHINHTLKEITEQFKRMAGASGAVAANPQVPTGTDQKPAVSPRQGELPGGLLTEMKNRFHGTSSSENLLASPPPYERYEHARERNVEPLRKQHDLLYHPLSSTTHSTLKVNSPGLPEPQNGPVLVSVFNASNNTKLEFFLKPADTIVKLKEMYIKKMPHLHGKLNLVFNGKPVESMETIADLSVKPGAMFIIYHRSVGR